MDVLEEEFKIFRVKRFLRDLKALKGHKTSFVAKRTPLRMMMGSCRLTNQTRLTDYTELPTPVSNLLWSRLFWMNFQSFEWILTSSQSHTKSIQTLLYKLTIIFTNQTHTHPLIMHESSNRYNFTIHDYSCITKRPKIECKIESKIQNINSLMFQNVKHTNASIRQRQLFI